MSIAYIPTAFVLISVAKLLFLYNCWRSHYLWLEFILDELTSLIEYIKIVGYTILVRLCYSLEPLPQGKHVELACISLGTRANSDVGSLAGRLPRYVPSMV